MWFHTFHGSREARKGGWIWINHCAFPFASRLRKDLVWLEEFISCYAPLHRWLSLPGFIIVTWTFDMSPNLSMLSISPVTVHYGYAIIASGSTAHTEVRLRRHWERAVLLPSSCHAAPWQLAGRHGRPWRRTRSAELGRNWRPA